jgi:type IV secretory pathway TraG/TraD family ATPase VirD4
VAGPSDPARPVVAQLRSDLAAVSVSDERDRAGLLQNLQNRLAFFHAPPFLELCSRSDFRIDQVTGGERVAFLLPTGAFPAAAKPLGRVALSQFKHAVLASAPGVRKVAVLDEFHNFVSADWGPFLNEARSRDGAAVMAMQSLADLPPERRAAMLANARTVVVTPGCEPGDAAYWADVFGKELRERRSYSFEHRALDSRRRAHVRVDSSEEYRWTPTEIAELPAGYALIRVTHGRTIYPATRVRVERG